MTPYARHLTPAGAAAALFVLRALQRCVVAAILALFGAAIIQGLLGTQPPATGGLLAGALLAGYVSLSQSAKALDDVIDDAEKTAATTPGVPA